ncbi:hypothetical protein ABZX69_38150 [Streptomyces sp. NPDC004074]|uniref:hypothetical protein n=1 Tax=Streptomyces sp. NPDC004074 TaxID=3154277 RepID=UPI0033A2115F
MTRIEEILSRALLVRDRTVPRDIVPSPAPATHSTTCPAYRPPARDSMADEAAKDLRALCETLVTHTPATAVAKFVTDQVPEPRSALVLACVLQLTDTDDGARFWWQYAAGAGQAAAAYCLYLHHLALGEADTANWWHRQTDDVQPPPPPPARQTRKPELPPRQSQNPEGSWYPADHRLTSTSTTTILRILRHLAKTTARPRSTAVTELMAYVPTAVAVGYLRHSEMDLPMPGPDFARRIRTLLSTATKRPDAAGRLPSRPDSRKPASNEPIPDASPTPSEAVHPQLGETARR